MIHGHITYRPLASHVTVLHQAPHVSTYHRTSTCCSCKLACKHKFGLRMRHNGELLSSPPIEAAAMLIQTACTCVEVAPGQAEHFERLTGHNAKLSVQPTPTKAPTTTNCLQPCCGHQLLLPVHYLHKLAMVRRCPRVCITPMKVFVILARSSCVRNVLTV